MTAEFLGVDGIGISALTERRYRNDYPPGVGEAAGTDGLF
jgi:hypothetical protein